MQIQNIPMKKVGETKVNEAGVLGREAVALSEIKVSYIGEEQNKNIRTRIEAPGEMRLRMGEEERKLSDFKEEAKKNLQTYLKNANHLSASVLKELDEEGVHVENSEASLVEKNVSNILKNREEKREHLERQIKDLAEEREAIEKMAVETSGEENRAVIDRLKKSGLPVTKANIGKLSASMELAEEALFKLDENAIFHTIRNKAEETVESLLKAENLPGREAFRSFTDRAMLWEGMKEQAKELLFNGGVEKTAENTEAAKWLFYHNLPLDSENIAQLRSFQALKEELSNTDGREALLRKVEDRMLSKMAKGEEPLSTAVGTKKQIIASHSVYYFKSVVETKAIYKDITARRQIEEIRLRLTEEAAVKMLDKGFKIDVNDLKGLVEKLRNEEEGYFNSLTETGMEETLEFSGTEGESRLSAFEASLSIRSYHFNRMTESGYRISALSAVYEVKERISLRNYHLAGLRYEEGATEVRADLGDSVKKAFSDIDRILRENNLPETEANRRAARILLYNRAEIDVSGVTKMKKASLLVDEVFSEMKPATVAYLIKSGENPLDMELSDLLARLKAINEELMPADEKYSTYLYKLEQRGEMGEDERKAYIGIYRLLSEVEKQDGSAVGGVLFSDKELTFRSLLASARTRRIGSFNKAVEEDFGELASVLSENRIDRQIEEAYSALLAGKIKRELETPDEDRLKETVKRLKETNVELSDIEKLMEVGEKVSFSTVVAQTEIRGGRRGLSSLFGKLETEAKEEIAALSEGILQGFEEKDFAISKSIELRDRLLSEADKLLGESTSYRSVRELIGIKQVLHLSAKRGRTETFDLPILYEEGKYADLQITLRRAEKSSEKGLLNLNLSFEESFIKLSLRVSGERLSGVVLSDDREKLRKLQEKKEDFSAIIREAGLSAGEITYHLGNIPSVFTDFDDIYSDGADTKSLYQLAKKASAFLFKELGIR